MLSPLAGLGDASGADLGDPRNPTDKQGKQEVVEGRGTSLIFHLSSLRKYQFCARSVTFQVVKQVNWASEERTRTLEA